MRKIILHIPHSSIQIPFYDNYIVPNKRLIEEMNLQTDWYTDELFDLPYKKVIAQFSRIFCDVERFSDDTMEVMSHKGMGMCYTHLDNGEPMRQVTPDLRARIRTQFYDQHHKSFEKACAEYLKSDESVLVVDCHSYPDKPLNRDLIQSIPRPDFCIGSDDFHTPRELVSSSNCVLECERV